MKKDRKDIKLKKAAFYDSEYGSNTYLQEAAFYETMMYLPIYKLAGIKEGLADVKEIMDSCGQILEGDTSLAPELTEDEKAEIAAYLPYIEAMVKSLESKNINVSSAIINDMSWNLEVDVGKEKGVKFPPDGIQMCSFIRGEYLFTSNRGTPAGSWFDNAYALIGRLIYSKTYTGEDGKKWRHLSPMHVKALQYAEYIKNKYEDSGLTAISGGHSKGGTEAQLQALMFPEFYKMGLSFDGQGSSPEFVRECKKNWGEEEFQRRCSNLYGINFVNDYVHPMGISLIPAKNILMLGNPLAAKRLPTFGEQIAYLLGGHFVSTMIDVETGELIPAYYINGVNTAGPVALYMAEISKTIMAMPPILREDSCLSIMGALQLFYAKHLPTESNAGVWGYPDLLKNMIEGISPATFIIAVQAIGTSAGNDFLEYLTKVIDMSALVEIVEKATSAIGFFGQPIFMSTVPVYGIGAKIVFRGKTGIQYDKMAQTFAEIDSTNLKVRGSRTGELDGMLDDLSNITSVRMHRAINAGKALRKQVLSLTDDYNDYNQALDNYTKEMRILENDFCNAMDVWQ